MTALLAFLAGLIPAICGMWYITVLERRLRNLAEQVAMAADEAMAAREAHERALAAPKPKAPPRPAQPAPLPPPPPAPRYAHIYALADQGLAVPDIARRTGLTRGEVELILGLRGVSGS